MKEQKDNLLQTREYMYLNIYQGSNASK